MEFKIRLKQLRKERHISQTKLASDLNVSSSLIGFYETGDRMPSMEVLEALSDYFNVDIDYLLGRSDVSTYLLNPTTVEALKTLDQRPEMKMLFSAAQDATPEEIIQAVKIIEALKR